MLPSLASVACKARRVRQAHQVRASCDCAHLLRPHAGQPLETLCALVEGVAGRQHIVQEVQLALSIALQAA